MPDERETQKIRDWEILLETATDAVWILLLGMFVFWDYNPQNWPMYGRVAFLLLVFCMLVVRLWLDTDDED